MRYFALLLLVLLPLSSRGQETVNVFTSEQARVTLGGTLQTRFSYGYHEQPDGVSRERLGFGLRRMRLRTRAQVGERLGFYVQLEGNTGRVEALDLVASYRLDDHWTVRVGRMVSAQPRALILTGHTRIDAVDREAIAERWDPITIGSAGRDFGIDLRYRGARSDGYLFVGNGNGDWDRASGNYREGISGSDVTRGEDRLALHVAGYGNIKPYEALEVGAYLGYNASRNPHTAFVPGDLGRRYLSYAVHAYWGADPGSQPLRLKADVIGIRYEDRGVPTLITDDPQHWLGVAVLGAVRLHRAAEAFARYEYLNTYTSLSGIDETFVTAGVSFSYSAWQGQPYDRARLTLAYNAERPGSDAFPTQHQVVLQAQLAF